MAQNHQFFFSEYTQIHPITGKACTQDEFEAAGGKLIQTPEPKHKWFNEPADEIRPSGHIIKDIDPYKPVAADKETGERPVIGGRRQHRDFLRKNGYFEIGNSFVEPRREESSASDRVADIKRAMNSL